MDNLRNPNKDDAIKLLQLITTKYGPKSRLVFHLQWLRRLIEYLSGTNEEHPYCLIHCLYDNLLTMKQDFTSAKFSGLLQPLLDDVVALLAERNVKSCRDSTVIDIFNITKRFCDSVIKD